MKSLVRALLVLILLSFALQLVSCRFKTSDRLGELAVYPENIKNVPDIRVLIDDNQKEALVSVSGKYEIYNTQDTENSRPKGSGEGPVVVSITAAKEGIKLGKTLTAYDRILIKPLENSILKLNGINYGSDLFFIKQPDSKESQPRLRIIADIDIEEYLVGVVPSEMPSYWPVEALRAQAICARSYAFYKIKTRGHLDYDVKRTVASQVWNPSHKGSPVINMVVNSTKGIVLTDNWRLFPAYFSAECGGETKDGVNVFISRHISPLTGVDCPYCKTEAREWQVELPLKELEKYLKGSGRNIGNIRSIKALDNLRRSRENMGRVYDVIIYHDATIGMLTMPALHFRALLNNNLKDTKVKSTFFDLSIKDGILYIKGKGNGHGVGMCQYGARHLAKNNYGYKDILNYYYSGNTLVKLW